MKAALQVGQSSWPVWACFRSLVAIAILAAPLSAQIGRRPARPQVTRPDGAVWQVIRKNCTACHGIDDYAFFALSLIHI